MLVNAANLSFDKYLIEFYGKNLIYLISSKRTEIEIISGKRQEWKEH